jgi:hypothetical protein
METDFIEEYKSVLTEEECSFLVHDFERLHEVGMTFNRQNGPLGQAKDSQDDESLIYADAFLSQMTQDSEGRLFKVLNKHIHEYIKKYEVGMYTGRHSKIPLASEAVKIQRTYPSQGFHIWHCERNMIDFGSRVLAWSIYLNDVEEGGETEFIYQSKRFSPKAGTMLIWPAGFTHTHRGNPPLKGVKYIATGWYRLTI